MRKIIRYDFEELYTDYNEKPFNVFDFYIRSKAFYNSFIYKAIHILVLNKYLCENKYSEEEKNKFNQRLINTFSYKKKDSQITLKGLIKEVVILAGEYVDLVINSAALISNAKEDIKEAQLKELEIDNDIRESLLKHKTLSEEHLDAIVRKILLETLNFEQRTIDFINNSGGKPFQFYYYTEMFLVNITQNFKMSRNKGLELIADIFKNMKIIPKGDLSANFGQNLKRYLSDYKKKNKFEEFNEILDKHNEFIQENYFIP